MQFIKLLRTRSFFTNFALQTRGAEHAQKLDKSTGLSCSTIDPSEVENLSKFSNTWWDTNGDMRALHTLNSLRVQLVRDGLRNTGMEVKCAYLPLQSAKILDVGCGGGILSESLARIGAKVTGIDASADLINTAKEHAALDSELDGRINYVQTDIENFGPENRELYDAVVASEVIEHVNNKRMFLKYCIETLKPGGSIFLTTINKTLPAWLGGIIAAEHILKLVPKGTHDWNKFTTPAEIQCLLESRGCRTKLIHGMFYNPFTNEWFWMAYTSINYAIHAVKRSQLK